MPKAYIVNFNGQFSYEGLDEIVDETINMTSGYIQKEKLPNLPAVFRRYAEQATSDDILVLSGTNLVCCLAFNEWAQFFDKVNIAQHAKSKDGCFYIRHDIYTNLEQETVEPNTPVPVPVPASSSSIE